MFAETLYYTSDLNAFSTADKDRPKDTNAKIGIKIKSLEPDLRTKTFA